MKKAILSFVYLFLVLSLQAQVEYYDSEAFVTEAIQLMEEKKYSEARAVMAKVHQSDEEYYNVCQIETANTYLAEDNTADAIALYKELYDNSHFDNSPSLYVNYGSVLSEAEKFEEAEKVFKEAEAQFPHYSHLLFNMGISYYRSGDIQKAIDYTKQTITVNPGHSKAHYFLGVLALESGQIAEGALAMLGFLADAPSDELALNAIKQLNVKMAQNYIDEKDHVYSETGDDFSKLTLILRNQFPLNEKYKLECDIDDIFTRHVQAVAEYSAKHTVKDGFFEKQYIPFLADIYEKGHIEDFTYYTLSGVEAFEDQLKKKEKGMTSFYKEYFVNEFWYHFGIRKMQHLGKESDVIIYCENSQPTMISEYEGKLKTGWTTFVDEYGRMTGKAKLVNDIPEGMVTYYNSKGAKTEEVVFENGEKNGNQIIYYDSGEKRSEWINVKGLAEGLYTTYYKDGSIYCQSSFKADEYDGDSYCNYASGQHQYKLNYDMGKLDGQKVNYYENGKLSSKEEYVAGKLNGQSEYYDIDGRKLSSIVYKDDEVTKSYSIKDKDGVMTFDYLVDGDNVIITEFLNGQISQVSFVKNNELTGTEYYSDGKKFSSQKFDGEKVEKCIQYQVGDEKGKKLNLKNHKTYDLSGNLISHRKFKDGKIHGLSTYYYLNGNVRSKLNYVDGKEDGNSKLYDKNGNLTQEYYLKEDVLEGLYKEYKNGVLTFAYNYKEGKLNGPTMVYHANGAISSIGFYKDDILQGKLKYYNSNGILTNVDEYENGELTSSTYIERDGTVGSKINYLQPSGPATRQVSYSPVKYEMNLLNGELHGPYYGVDDSGDSIYITNFSNGKREGRSRYFSASGAAYFVGNIVNGNQHGLCKYYDDLGVQRVTSEFKNDKENGKEKLYSYNGNVIKEYTNILDILQGEAKLYNSKGKLLMTLYYVDDVIMKYKSYLDTEWIKLSGEKKSIVVYYEDKSIALEITIVKGYLDGKKAIYDDNGNQVYERNYSKGMTHGDTKLFYPNGKLYRLRGYKNSFLDGEVLYYDEDGSVKLKYTNVLDEKDGPYEMYDNGKLTITKIYEADELIEIK